LFYSFTDRHAESCQLRFAAAPIASAAIWGETGIRVLTRMMGLLLTAIAVQFMLNGLTDIGLVKEFG
jgi:small neutral amino acid transporter SnatA (MarC family)